MLGGGAPLKPLGKTLGGGLPPPGAGLPALDKSVVGGLTPPPKPLSALGALKTPKTLSPIGTKVAFSPVDKPQLESVRTKATTAESSAAEPKDVGATKKQNETAVSAEVCLFGPQLAASDSVATDGSLDPTPSCSCDPNPRATEIRR